MLKRGVNLLTFDDTLTPARDERWGVAQDPHRRSLPLPHPTRNKSPRSSSQSARAAFDGQFFGGATRISARALQYCERHSSYLRTDRAAAELLTSMPPRRRRAAGAANIFDSYMFTVEKALRFGDRQGAETPAASSCAPADPRGSAARQGPKPASARSWAGGALTAGATRRRCAGILRSEEAVHECRPAPGCRAVSPATDGDEADIDLACERCLLPLLEALARKPELRVALHFTGHLLDCVSRRQPAVWPRSKELVNAGQAKSWAALYGGIPRLLSEFDVRGQVEMTAEYWESALTSPPAGFWLSELAWCSDLPRLFDENRPHLRFVSSGQVAWSGSTHRSSGRWLAAAARWPRRARRPGRTIV